MADNAITRRVAAILAADAVGYTRLMAADEPATIDALDVARAVFAEHIEANQGRVVDTAGDSVLAVFETTEGAVLASVAIQARLAEINEPVPEERRMQFRIGLHLGDIREKADGTVYGDGVNVAARLEGIAEPGAIIVSDVVQGVLRGHFDIGFADAGSHEVKNVAEPVRAYRVTKAGAEPASAPKPRPTRLAIAAAAGMLVVAAGLGIWWTTGEPSPPPMVTADGTPTDDPVLAAPTGPAIAVLPFDDLSEETGQAFFADGLTEDIITGLSRFNHLRVIARNSTFQYKGQAVDVREVGEALGVRYVLEGSVRRSGESLRVTAQLLDARDGTHLWAENYARDLTTADIFAIQDSIMERIVGVLGDEHGVISRAALEETAARHTDNLVAYECVLRAHGYYDVITPTEHLAVRACLEEAVALDPTYAEAWGWLSHMYQDEYKFGFNPRPEAEHPLARAIAASQKAIQADATSRDGYEALASAHYFAGDLEQFRTAAERALSLNPNNSRMLGWLGSLTAFAGDWDRGIALTDKAVSLNPNHPTWIHATYAFQHYIDGNYEEALLSAKRFNLPGFYRHHVYLTMVYGQLGRRDEAEASIAEINALYPGYADVATADLESWFKDEALFAAMMEGLEKAGLFDEPEAATRPVIAVLPFDSMSEDPAHQFFADGLAEDIITRLARFPDIGVIARNSSFQYKGENVDVRTVAEELGATYVLEGSVRRSENDIRVIAQLLDATDGTSIWSETYDRDLSAGSVFEIQDDITARVVGVIASADSIIAMAVIEASATKAPSNLTSYECVIRTGEYWRSITPDVHLQARTCLERVAREEPEFARAWSLLAALAVDEFLYGYNVLAESDPPLDRASAYARRALELDPNEPWGHWNLGRVAFYRHNLSAFRTAAERALALLPNDAMLLAAAGQSAAYSGEWERGITMMDQAIKLNPHHQPWYHFLYFYEAYRQGLDDAALEAALKIEMPGYFWAHQVKAAAYGQLGMTEEAGKAVAAIHDLWPGYSIQTMIDLHRMWNHGDDVIERMVDGLRKAGLPEDTN